MKMIHDNILNIKHGIIIHQVNCKHVMGAGLAKSIKEKYPKHFEDYINSSPITGTNVVTCINNDFYIIGMYAQLGYGTDRKYTLYPSFERCLRKVKVLSDDTNLPVYIPYGIGCGLAGGEWDVIHRMIEENIPDAILVKKD